jgi:hypothetical protein
MDKTISDYMAEQGRKGGSVKSEAKARASVANGAKGGAPRIVTVSFTACGSSDRDTETRIRIPVRDEYGEILSGRGLTEATINRAIEKIYGKNCFWWADSGLGVYYGQVMKALKPTKNNSQPGNSSVTYRMRVDIA